MDRSSGPRRQEADGDWGARSQPRPPAAAEAFVGNLSYDAGEDELRQLFNACGNIIRVKILTGPDGRSKGVGFVGFDAEPGLEAALRLDGSEFMGRNLKVSRSGEKGKRESGGEAPRGGAPRADTSVAFVGNVSYQCTEDDLTTLFSGCGEIRSVRMAKDPDGRPKGFAHIEFADPSSVDQAIRLSGTDLKGRQIRVDHSTGSKDSGSRGRGRGGRGGAFGGPGAAPQGRSGGWD